MSDFKLPFTVNVESTTYQYLAFQLGAFKPLLSSQYNQWIFTKFINCQFNPQEGEYSFTDEDTWGLNTGLSTSSYMELEPTLLDIESFGLIRTIEAMLKNGYYVSGDFDEFDIPGKSVYQKFHHDHDYFIFGFNRQQQFFWTAGYMENGNYSVFRVNYSDYLKSLHGLSVNRVPMAFRKVFPEKFSTRELDNESVFTRIRHYLNSENDFDHNQAEAIYGMNAWRHLSEKSVEISVEDLDPRAYRLFWEHKIIMLLRLMNSINVMRFKSQFDCINQYRKEVVERAHSVYLLSIKSKLAPNKQNNQSISSIIKQVCDAETTILASAIQ